MSIEVLESRQLLTVLLPRLSYDSIGVLGFDADTQVFNMIAKPLTLQTAFPLPNRITNGTLTMQVGVDATGKVISNSASNTFVVNGTIDEAIRDPFTNAVIGSIDINGDGVIGLLSGTLLIGHVAVGSTVVTSYNGTTSSFDFTFNTDPEPPAQADWRLNHLFGSKFDVNVQGGDLGPDRPWPSFLSAITRNLSNPINSGFPVFSGSWSTDFAAAAQGDVTPMPLGGGTDQFVSIGGFVYVDANNDGIKQATESPIANATVALFDSGGNVIATQQTLADGSYNFTNLVPGSYTIKETQPTGYLDGKDTQGTPGNGTVSNDIFSNITLAIGDSGQNNNFGELLPASIGNYVWKDNNANGIQDASEVGLNGVLVKLLDSNGNVITTTTTITNPSDATTAGFYSFTGLYPGTYSVQFITPTGYYLTNPDLGGNDATDSDANATTGKTGAYTLVQGQYNDTVDAGLIAYASIGGFVYVDANNDGIKQPGESSIANTTVTLLDAGGNAIATQQTLADGSYNFTNLAPGTYMISETQPGAYLDGIDTIGTPGGTTSNDQFSSIVLGAGVNGVNNNFGELLPASIGGFVYYDANNDGIKQPTETGIATTVTLTGTDDLGNAVTRTATSDSTTGAYSFTNLRPGTYTIKETQPGAYLDGIDTIGTPGGITSNDQFSSIALGAGVNGVNNNFGELLPASIGGFVYYDANNDGIKQSTEAGIATTVTLTGTDDLGNAVTLTATSDGTTGAYSFTNLRPGTYTIKETQPSSYLDGIDTIGTPGGTTSNDQFSKITLGAGVNGVNNNFGELLPASIGNYVWEDCNGNGIQDAGEAGLNGIVVNLLDSNGNVIATTTTANNPADLTKSGFYKFTGLFPGSYSVQFVTPPTGYYLTTPDLGGNDATDSDANATTGRTGSYTLVAGQYNDTVDAGFIDYSSLSGHVYDDLNNDGCFNQSVEEGIPDVTVTLAWAGPDGVFGTSDDATTVTTTDIDGNYTFSNLKLGNYRIQETQPADFKDGKDTVGTIGGVKVGSNATNDLFSNIQIKTCGSAGINYDFGEVGLLHGLTGTIGFWANKNGQAMIQLLNADSKSYGTSKNLGNWLASSFPNMYGSTAGANAMAGKTTAQIAARFIQVFKVTGQKLDAQVLAVCLAIYTTTKELNTSTAGIAFATQHGFVNPIPQADLTNLRNVKWDLDNNGDAFAAKVLVNKVTCYVSADDQVTLPADGQLTVWTLLSRTNSLAVNGVLYANGITVYSADMTTSQYFSSTDLRNEANVVYSDINQSGDIIA